jgi:serine/threonine protein kinase
MAEESPGDFGRLTPSQARRVDALCRRFEVEWRSGREPRIEDYLTEADDLEREVLLRELLVLELELRQGRGERPGPRQYRERFPGHTALVDAAFDDAESRSPGRGADGDATVSYPPVPPDGTGNRASTADDSDRDRAAPGGSGYPVPGYESLGELGRGAMGVVYKARQVRLRRVVALKVILSGTHASPRELARFRIESEAVARLQHPNIVTLYEVGEYGGLPYFSLEYVAGGSLADMLDRTPMPARQAARLVELLARAIHAAHQQGIIHRDLKPANVLLAVDGTPKIIDFGLARRLDDSAGPTSTGAILGTPSYMPPEQAAGKTQEIGAAADIYALGAILYELLTRRPPFQAATRVETIRQVLSREPLPPSILAARVPLDLERICLKCLQKEAGRRYSDALALAEDLRSWQVGEPIRARPIGLKEEGLLLMRRNPWAGLILHMFMGILAMASLGELTDRRPSPGTGLLSAFLITLLGFLRPSPRRVGFASLTLIALGSLLVGPRGIGVLSNLGVGVGLGTSAVLSSRVVTRFCRRTIGEVLPGALLGFMFGGLMLIALFDAFSTWRPNLEVLRRSCQLIGTWLGPLVLGFIYVGFDRWQSTRQGGVGRGRERPKGRAVPPASSPLASTLDDRTLTEVTPDLGAPGAAYLGADSWPPSDCPPPVSPTREWRQIPGYEVLDVLGRGGMGTVYKARQIRADRMVALKVIRASEHAGKADRERFSREAQAVARLEHPNIVQVYDMGEHGGQPYFAMEYVAGGTLADRLGGQPMPTRPAAQLIQTLASAIQASHQREIIHRDLKPQNVLMTLDDQPKIADFGLARPLAEAAGLTASGAILGTPSYMAPEQAACRMNAVGPISDVYALGAILYELLTGRPPFRGQTALETLQQVLTLTPVAPRILQPGVPRDLESVCLKCLKKRVHGRYANAQALADDLGRFLSGKPVQASPLPLWKRLVTARSRHVDGLADEFTPALLRRVTLGLSACLLSCVLISRGSTALTLFVFGLFPTGLYALLWRDSHRPRRLGSLVVATPDEPVTSTDDGWIMAPLSHLRFPPLCSDCGIPTHGREPVRVKGPTHRLELDIPVCSRCGLRHRGRPRRRAGLILGSLATFILALALGASLRMSIGLTLAGAALGFKLGTVLAPRPPVRLGRYSPRRGIVGLRFRRPDYTARFLALMRADEQARNNVQRRLALTPEQAAGGTKARVVAYRTILCPDCQKARNRVASCPACAGRKASFVRRAMGRWSTTCSLCGGGKRDGKCQLCEDCGTISVPKEFSIETPRGITTGTQLRLRGQGNELLPGLPAGDLLIEIEVR